MALPANFKTSTRGFRLCTIGCELDADGFRVFKTFEEAVAWIEAEYDAAFQDGWKAEFEGDEDSPPSCAYAETPDGETIEICNMDMENSETDPEVIDFMDEEGEDD